MDKFRSFLFLFALLAALWLPVDSTAQEPVILRVSPQTSYASTSTETMVSVRVENVEDLIAYSIVIKYDPKILNVLAVKNGDFLEEGLYGPDNGIDPSAGIIRFGMSQMGDSSRSGSGNLITIRLRALQPGQTTEFVLVAEESYLVKWPEVKPIPFNIPQNGTIHTVQNISRLFLPLVVR